MKNKFIDLEAQEDSDEEFDGVSEDAAVLEDETQPDSKRPRNQLSDDDEDSQSHQPRQARLDDIVDTITQKYVRVEAVDSQEMDTHEEIHTEVLERRIRRTKKPEDWPLWRVKCTPGEEYYVLHLLILKHMFISTELRSAFYNPHSPGTVYLEACFRPGDNVGSLLQVLQTLSSVHIRIRAVVPENQLAACLSIPGSVGEVLRSPGEWVRIRRGLYQGDVGVVVDSFEKWGGIRTSAVALVPRLSPARQKRKKTSPRPPPQLFDVNNCVQRSVRKTAFGYTYNRFTFEGGLLLKTFPHSGLERARMMPPELVPLFCQSSHPLVRPATMPLPEHWRFEIGESVWVYQRENIEPVFGTILQTSELAGYSYTVATDAGHQMCSPNFLSKDISPGNFVEILAGEYVGKEGFVVSRNEALLSIAPGRFCAEPDLWAHVNSVKVTTPPVAPVAIEPWIDLEVKIQSGPLKSMKAIVKHVQPDGRGSLRLAVYVPKLFNTIDVDLFMLTESSTGKLLFDYRPLQPHQQGFRILPELKAMRTGRVPWVGMKVAIVNSGEYKAQSGIVRDVTHYRLDPRTPKKRSGLTIIVERLVMGPSGSNQLVKVDYENVRYARNGFKLADIFLPHDDYYIPFTQEQLPEDADASGGQTQTLPLPDGSATPLPTEFEQVYIFTGAWSPGSHTPNLDVFGTSDWEDQQSLGEQSSSSVDDLGLCASTILNSNHVDTSLSHWILHPKLLGIAIRVDIQGGPYDTIQKKKKSGIFVKTSLEGHSILPMVVNLGGRRCPVSVDQIHKFRERPKPASERSLMVVIEGPHTGKHVRQMYHFFQGSQSEENDRFIAIVTDRSGIVEVASDEYLELKRDEVELVQETADERKFMNSVLKDARDSYRTARPEVRM